MELAAGQPAAQVTLSCTAACMLPAADRRELSPDLNTASADGLRQMLPRQTNSTFVLPAAAPCAMARACCTARRFRCCRRGRCGWRSRPTLSAAVCQCAAAPAAALRPFGAAWGAANTRWPCSRPGSTSAEVWPLVASMGGDSDRTEYTARELRPIDTGFFALLAPAQRPAVAQRQGGASLRVSLLLMQHCCQPVRRPCLYQPAAHMHA